MKKNKRNHKGEYIPFNTDERNNGISDILLQDKRYLEFIDRLINIGLIKK